MSAEEPRRGLSGHMDLLCALDARGVSSLQRQSFRVPFHISKPHLDAGTLVVNVANPTAGLLEGDRVECTVHVARGARLLLATPAANRAHRMRAGFAQVQQRFTVEEGAWLEFWPELFIPQAGTSYRQQTTLSVEPGGELFFVETLAPGRVASGECFAFARLEWETDVCYGDHHAARERYTLTPESEAIQALQRQFPAAYYASCFLITERLDEASACWAELHALQSDSLWIGSSRLAHGGWVIKLLAAGSVPLRTALGQVRVIAYGALGAAPPALRRISGIG